MNTPSSSARLDYLDAVRAFALLLGIVFHASISFMPIFIGWAVMDVSTSSIVPVFMLVSHSFRMELFFLIAGFFSHMAFHGKGAKTFLKSRFFRLAIPFVVGWFIMRPLLVASWIMGYESMRGEVNLSNALTTGIATLGDLPEGLFVGSHLWFLYYLLLITACLLTIRYLLCLHAPTQRRLVELADAAVSWVSHSRFALFVLSIPTAVCLWFMSHWGMDTPDKTLAPDIPVFLVYGGFFLLGWALHRQTRLMERFARLTVGKFALCLGAMTATILLADYQMNTGHPQYSLLKASFMLGYAIMMWTLVSLTIGLFKRFLDRPSKTVRYVADASYWLYLVHLPIVLWLQIAFAELPWHWSIKLAAISGIAIGASILLYDLFVRSTFIGVTLNGRRKPRRLFRYGKRSNEPAKAPLQAAG